MTCACRTIGERTFDEVRKMNISQQGRCGLIFGVSLLLIFADSRDEAILEWLSPLNMYQKQQDTISTRRGTTGSWLLRDPVFHKWIDDESSERTLWCPGDRECYF